MIAYSKRLLKVKQQRLAILNVMRILAQALLLHPIDRLLLAPRSNATVQLKPSRRATRGQVGARDLWRFHVVRIARSKSH